MKSFYLPYRHSSIHYYQFGTGREWLFCFHGYGEDGSTFSILEPELGEKYTLICIDMPFHGKTDWQDGLLFDVNDLLVIMRMIKPAGLPLSLLGYSMGGRIAMQIVEEQSERVLRLVLVAPDGLHKNKWQWLATRTLTGNRLFAFAMRHPFIMMQLMHLGGRFGLYNKSMLKFVHHYLDDDEERRILYRRWTTMRKFRPRLDLLKKLIASQEIPVHMLFGRYDRVILARHGLHFRQGAEEWIHVTELQAGHQLLKEKNVSLIAGWLL